MDYLKGLYDRVLGLISANPKPTLWLIAALTAVAVFT